MKTIVIYLILNILFLSLRGSVIVYADNTFARAEESINLYRLTSTSDNIDDIICIVEKSYFVEILSDNGDYYKVNYNGVNGFVKKNDVRVINETPSTPFPYNIKIVIENDCNLRSTPTTQSSSNNILSTIYSGESNLNFIGRIYGEEAIDFGGTTWYYVEYDGNYGYVYNKYIKSISSIYENPDNYTYKQNTIADFKNPLNSIPSIVLVVLLLIPAIFMIILLYFPFRKIKKPKEKKYKNIKEKY